MAEARGVLIAGEVQDGKLIATTKELLAHGRKLARELGEELAVALFADHLGDTPKEAIAFGADKVYAVTDPLLKDTPPESYLEALQKLCSEHTPRVLLLGKTGLGREVGPRVAVRLG